MNSLLPYLHLKQILFVGIGNVLKADDGAGVFLASLIQQHKGIQTLIVEMGIENHIGKINTIDPDLTVLIDAADMKKEPGIIDFIPIESTTNLTTHTHNIALKNLAKHLHMKTMVLGIQPADMTLGNPLTPCVRESCEAWAETINAEQHHKY